MTKPPVRQHRWHGDHLLFSPDVMGNWSVVLSERLVTSKTLSGLLRVIESNETRKR